LSKKKLNNRKETKKRNQQKLSRELIRKQLKWIKLIKYYPDKYKNMKFLLKLIEELGKI